MGILIVTDPHGAMLDSMRKAFGEPGDHGYGTAKWMALTGLYSFLEARSNAARLTDGPDIPPNETIAVGQKRPVA